jgi:hypothetical protein
MRWIEHVALMVKKKNTRFMGRHEGKRPLGRPRNRWEDNIQTNLK